MGSRALTASRAFLAITAMVMLGGCSILGRDGVDDSMRPMDTPLTNHSWEAPPYVRVAGNPMPDGAWARERASECEPWQLGDNGCGRPHAAAAAQGPRIRHAAVRHHRPAQRRARPPACNCTKASAGS